MRKKLVIELADKLGQTLCSPWYKFCRGPTPEKITAELRNTKKGIRVLLSVISLDADCQTHTAERRNSPEQTFSCSAATLFRNIRSSAERSEAKWHKFTAAVKRRSSIRAGKVSANVTQTSGCFSIFWRMCARVRYDGLPKEISKCYRSIPAARHLQLPFSRQIIFLPTNILFSQTHKLSSACKPKQMGQKAEIPRRHLLNRSQIALFLGNDAAITRLKRTKRVGRTIRFTSASC